MEMDWQIDKSILECIRYQLENKVNCDVKFKVGEDQEIIEAHKFILSARSPVFDRMFNGSFKESQMDPIIPDVTPAAFKALLRYCYYECLEIEGEVALSLIYAAKKYMLPILERGARKTLIEKLDSSKIWEVCEYSTYVGDEELHTCCITYLKENLNSSNLCDVFEYAVTTRQKGLRRYCRKHFQKNLSETNILDVTKYVATTPDKDLHATCRRYLKNHLRWFNIWEVYKYALDEGDDKVLLCCREYLEGSVSEVKEALQAKDFLNIRYEVLLDVMHINDKVDKESVSGFNPGIGISEIELFKACNRWAEAECKRQKIEGDGSNKRIVLGECLSLIRFPTMLQKDLNKVVFPTLILTQAGSISLGQYMDRDPGSHCQVDFPSARRQFAVGPLTTYANMVKSTVYIESEVRVLLTRVWLTYNRGYTVTVTVMNESSKRSWSMLYNTKHSTYVVNGTSCILQFIDMEPQVLEAGVRYTLAAEQYKNVSAISSQPGVEYIGLKVQYSGYNGVKATPDGRNSIYALTLSLV